jgi:hypothetical protein
VVIVLATGTKVGDFKPIKSDGFLMAIKIRSSTSLVGEVSRRPNVIRCYGMLKIPAEYDRDTSLPKLTNISRQISPRFATRYLCCYFPESYGG